MIEAIGEPCSRGRECGAFASLGYHLVEVCAALGFPAPPRRWRTVADVRAAGGYDVIYLDPAWKYRNIASNGAACEQYDVVVAAELATLPIKQLAARDCVMFCWATYPLLPDFLATIARWGFRYSTIAFQWVKYYGRTLKPAELRRAARELEAIADAIEAGLITGHEEGLRTTPCLGLGNWTRANTEPCFVAVRGRPKRVNLGISQLVETFEDFDEEVIRAPRNRHSAKPLQVRRRIVELCGASKRRLEMFARVRGDGFDAWGDDPALGGPDVLITDRDLAIAHYVDVGGMTMTNARRHWIMYCILNNRGDHGATDEELAAVRAELAQVLK